MSFARFKTFVENGDLVILFLGYNYMLPLKLSKGETYQTRFGALRHDDVIGKKYGTKVKTAKGYLYILHPTCELWTGVLPHRTQILYPVDISYVITQLELKPGSIVVESGTGSGSLSHALIRAVAPTGHLYTFDFHEERLKKAREEFDEHGIGKWVTAKHQDVICNGFELENIADAVFLDIPAPWDAIPHAKRALKRAAVSRICSFSPCIEQVQAACKALHLHGFTDVVTYECLARNLDIITANVPMAELGYGECKDQYYDYIAEESWSACREVAENDSTDNNFNETPSDASKDALMETNGDSSRQASSQALPVNLDKKKTPVFSFKSANVPITTPGHTGFLTFATLFPQE